MRLPTTTTCPTMDTPADRRRWGKAKGAPAPPPLPDEAPPRRPVAPRRVVPRCSGQVRRQGAAEQLRSVEDRQGEREGAEHVAWDPEHQQQPDGQEDGQ